MKYGYSIYIVAQKWSTFVEVRQFRAAGPETWHGPRLGPHLWIPQGVRSASSWFFRNLGFRRFRVFGVNLRIQPPAEAATCTGRGRKVRSMPVPIFRGLGHSDPKLWPLKEFNFCRNPVYGY